MEKLHVIYIITKLELGGAQKVCLSLIDRIEKSGYGSTLISGADGILLDQAKKHNLILLKNFKRELSFTFLFKEIKNFFELITQIKKIKSQHPDVIVHTHSTKAGIIGRWAAFFAGIKIRIHTIHGFAFHNHQNKIVWLLIYLTELFTSFVTTHFVCVSSYDINLGNKLFPRFAKKHSLIRAAVDYEKFTAARKTTLENLTPNPLVPSMSRGLTERDKTFTFGTVACFKKQKNLIDLFKSFELVHAQNPNCKLEVIGDGILRPELEAWIKTHNLQEKIILLGWQQNVQEFMVTWNAFVLSSLWEGLPCAIIEARLLGLPVVSYDTGGIKDVIINGKNGFLVNQNNWKELAQKMLILTQNETLLSNLSYFQENLAEFSDSEMVKQHTYLYLKANKNAFKFDK